MYYQGDYYRGDYYSGDPFLGIGSLIGFAAKGFSKLFKKKATTALARTNMGMMGRAPGMIAGMGIGQMIPRMPSFAPKRPGTVLERGPVRRTIEKILPGGRTGLEAEACLAGYHMNKQTSFGKATMGMEAGTFCVRNRRMNVANPRALRRSLRRVCGFGKLAARTRTSIGRAATAVGAGRGRSSGRSCAPKRKCA